MKNQLSILLVEDDQNKRRQQGRQIAERADQSRVATFERGIPGKERDTERADADHNQGQPVRSA